MGAAEGVERLPVCGGDRGAPDPYGDNDLVAVGLAGIVQQFRRRGQQHRDERQRPSEQRGRARPVHLSPETTIESTMCRWAATKSTISGTIATVVAAITSVHWELNWDCSPAVATVSTRHLPPLVITSGHMKLFHCETTVISVRAARTGLLDGITTCTIRSSVFAPSRRAALIKSFGIMRKCSRSRKIAYGEPNMKGSTSAQNVLRRPTWAIIRYIGTTVTVPGTINVAM